MSILALRTANECRFDVVVLGEVMLRLDPGEDRVRTARTFRVSEGGGEYNVGRALRRCFGRYSAARSLRPDEVDWDRLFGSLGARWLHTGGIFAGLSEATLETTRAAMASARRHGAVVSYDINYRPSLWAAAGGVEAAERLTTELIGSVDVLFGIDPADFTNRVGRLARTRSAPDVMAAAVRVVHSASLNDWGAMAWSRSDGIVTGTLYERLEVLDRVGGGDGFAAGVIHGLLSGEPLADCLELGIALGALTMTTAGDTSSVDETEVRRLTAGAGGSTIR